MIVCLVLIVIIVSIVLSTAEEFSRMSILLM